MSDLIERKIEACLYMINHFKDSAQETRNLYEDLNDFYVMYDFYMNRVEKYEKIFKSILNT